MPRGDAAARREPQRHRDTEIILGSRSGFRVGRRRRRRSLSVEVFSVPLCLCGSFLLPMRRIRAMEPMPSGGASQEGEEAGEAPRAVDGGGAERQKLAGAVPVDEAGAARAGETFLGTRTGAAPAMHAAAAVRHGGLPAGASGTSAGATARGSAEIARGIAVPETAKAVCGRDGGSACAAWRRLLPCHSGPDRHSAPIARRREVGRHEVQLAVCGAFRCALSARLVQRQQAEAIAVHEPGARMDEPHRLPRRPLARRIARPRPIEDRIGGRRHLHHQAMGQGQLVGEEGDGEGVGAASLCGDRRCQFGGGDRRHVNCGACYVVCGHPRYSHAKTVCWGCARSQFLT